MNSFKTRLGSLTYLDPGNHLAKRCDQFLVLIEDMEELMTVATVDDDISVSLLRLISSVDIFLKYTGVVTGVIRIAR